MSGQKLRQQVRYATARDGVRLAWAESGSGPLVVKASNWLTHLEFERESPVWQHWLQFFSTHFRLVRFDERGCGMSEWREGDLGLEDWTRDLESVIEAARPEGPFTLFGVSQGSAACLLYALRYPERVERLILYGGYMRGAFHRGTVESRMTFQAMIDLARAAWGSENATFRQVFTSRFIPGGTREQLDWFNELCLKSTTGEVAAKLLEARGKTLLAECLSGMRIPTLVLHSRYDEVVPVEEGQMLASQIPGAEFVELDSRNHVLLEHETAWGRFCDAVLEFMKPQANTRGGDTFAALSLRERQVLALIADGFSNQQIAEQLEISEKTVRNHASNVFDKLGVWSRAQAIVFAKDRGFSG